MTGDSAHHRPAKASKTEKPEGWRNIASTIAILLIAPLFALFLITFVFQSYLVDGPSMQTTLQDKDRLIVWKVKRSWARITGNPYIPNRGDVVVFVEPKLERFGQSSGKQLIKRVIALPGERVVIKDGTLTVYNAERPDGFQPDDSLAYGDVVDETPGQLDVKVPKGHIFVAGDNRNNSLDSRAFGPVDADNIVGKLVARFLPLSEAERF
jgi:signal peptidase I